MSARRLFFVLFVVVSVIAVFVFLFELTVPEAMAAGSLESWLNDECPQAFPGFVNRGMDGWSSSGENSDCPHGVVDGYVSPVNLTYYGTLHGVAFRVNTLVVGEQKLYFKPFNCGAFICSNSILLPEVGSYLIHDGCVIHI